MSGVTIGEAQQPASAEAQAASAASRTHAGYRADIDGLRAVAVLSVAGYHAHVPGFSGGYVGVDIFFVISGFLITRIILQDLARGSFSIINFYERRVRRIMPALFVVAFFVVCFTFLYRSPRDADIFGESVSLFAVFGANFFFYGQLDYFADPVEFYPLLHMWSLAVEEQFYVFFPLVLLGLATWRSAAMTPALGAIAALSLVGAVLMLPHDPKAVFFLTPFRMWELIVGALIAVAAAGPPSAALSWLTASQRRREAAALLGLALCLGPVVLYDEQTPFPALAALPPVLGAALVIAAGGPRAAPARAPLGARALSLRPVVYIGLASYSFYLWHWPALAAARYLAPEPLSIAQSIGVLALAFGASVLSLHLVERPFRRPHGVVSRQGVFLVSAGGIVALLLVGWLLQETKGLPGRFPGLAPLLADGSIRYGPAPGTCAPARDALPTATAKAIDPSFCRLTGSDAPDAPRQGPVVLLWGDSHMRALAPGFADWAAERGARAYLAWSASCPPALGYDRPVATRFHDCAAHNAAALAAADALDADLVVLAARWRGYASETVADGAAAAARALARPGRRIVALAQAPEFGGHTPTRLFRAAVTGSPHGLELSRDALRRADRLDGASQARVLAALAAAGATRVDLAGALCDADACRVEASDGASLYADSHHLSRVGARDVIGSLGTAFD